MNLEKYTAYQTQFENHMKTYLAELERSLGEQYYNQLSLLSQISPELEFNKEYYGNHKVKVEKFLESIRYSLLGEGKRFRPVLALAVADMLGHINTDTLNYALAVEMIHTYSLIHDDLPIMDNDDLRRGVPTNHKVYGEATALLAGDSLLTMAFEVLSAHLSQRPNSQKAIQILSQSAGFSGMVSGQFADLESQKTKTTIEELLLMQMSKTGALIKSAVCGSAVLSDCDDLSYKNLENYSFLLGLAFQIKDDILDAEDMELGSFPGILGLEKSEKVLKHITQRAIDYLIDFPKNDFLISICEYNFARNK